MGGFFNWANAVEEDGVNQMVICSLQISNYKQVGVFISKGPWARDVGDGGFKTGMDSRVRGQSMRKQIHVKMYLEATFLATTTDTRENSTHSNHRDACQEKKVPSIA